VELEDRHFAAIRLIVDGLPKRHVARQIKRSEQILYRWLRDPDFKRALTAERRLRWRKAAERAARDHDELLKDAKRMTRLADIDEAERRMALLKTLHGMQAETVAKADVDDDLDVESDPGPHDGSQAPPEA
jgi:transposase